MWALDANPDRPGRLPAGDAEGVFVSEDRGATWKPSREGLPPDRQVLSLAADPHLPGRIYAGLATAGFFSFTRSR